MHESRLVGDLVHQAELATNLTSSAITKLTVHIGAMAPVAPDALRRGITGLASQRWGHRPEVVIVLGNDPTDDAALGVTLTSIAVEG